MSVSARRFPISAQITRSVPRTIRRRRNQPKSSGNRSSSGPPPPTSGHAGHELPRRRPPVLVGHPPRHCPRRRPAHSSSGGGSGFDFKKRPPPRSPWRNRRDWSETHPQEEEETDRLARPSLSDPGEMPRRRWPIDKGVGAPGRRGPYERSGAAAALIITAATVTSL
jgi:hypothetical protein